MSSGVSQSSVECHHRSGTTSISSTEVYSLVGCRGKEYIRCKGCKAIEGCSSRTSRIKKNLFVATNPEWLIEYRCLIISVSSKPDVWSVGECFVLNVKGISIIIIDDYLTRCIGTIITGNIPSESLKGTCVGYTSNIQFNICISNDKFLCSCIKS